MGVYQSTTSRLWRRDEAEAEAAREILSSHVPDLESNLCVVCLVPARAGRRTRRRTAWSTWADRCSRPNPRRPGGPAGAAGSGTSDGPCPDGHRC
ncbi:hypothetical protein ACNAW0_07990 [Micromonospora sp. SL1-18]|uniref:hypothetical protein n=1 Tax=Micromonospora sp. SL1-18 TaxID=3399128 RepID=UPI003A4D84F3